MFCLNHLTLTCDSSSYKKGRKLMGWTNVVPAHNRQLDKQAVLIWVFRHFSLDFLQIWPKMSVMGKMVFMHKQRFPKCSLLKMWYITAWRAYKTHRILDRWKMALQFDSSVYWSLTRHVCAKSVCQEVIKKGRWGEKSRTGLQQVLWWVQMWNFWIKWSVYTEVRGVQQLLQSPVKQGGGSILV